MALLGEHYQYTEEQRADFTPVPRGWYAALIESSSLEPSTSNPANYYIKFKLNIVEPEDFAGRTLFDNCNLINANETAAKIARQQLNEIVASQVSLRGTTDLNDSAELHNNVMCVFVDVEPEGTDKNGKKYAAKNIIKKYMPYVGEDARSKMDEKGKIVGVTEAPAAPVSENIAAAPWRQNVPV